MISTEEMITIVRTWFLKSDKETQKEFLDCPRENLYKFHHSLGRNIRNEFKLWENEWKPEIVNGVDISPDHPDAISMEVITKVWEFLNDTN